MRIIVCSEFSMCDKCKTLLPCECDCDSANVSMVGTEIGGIIIHRKKALGACAKCKHTIRF